MTKAMIHEARVHDKLLHMYLSVKDDGIATLILTELQTRYKFYRNYSGFFKHGE